MGIGVVVHPGGVFSVGWLLEKGWIGGGVVVVVLDAGGVRGEEAVCLSLVGALMHIDDCVAGARRCVVLLLHCDFGFQLLGLLFFGFCCCGGGCILSFLGFYLGVRNWLGSWWWIKGAELAGDLLDG
jgi:hypothetical protein